MSLQEEGLRYVRIPWHEPQANDNVLVDQIIKHIKTLPPPVFVHCSTGFHSAFIVLLSNARQRGYGAQQGLEQGRSLGFDFRSYERFLKYYFYYTTRRTTYSA